MSDLDFQRQRFAALSDRLALGEELTSEELSFLDRMADGDPICGGEQALYAELETLEAPTSDRSRALVESALAELAKGNARGSASRPVRAPRFGSRGFYMKLVGVAGAAAAAALLMVPGRSHEQRTPEANALPAQKSTAPAEVPSGRVELVFVSGEVSIDGAVVARSSSLLREGSVLSVRDGMACIAMDPEIDVCVAAGSELRLTEVSEAERRLDLVQGKVAVQLEEQPLGSKLSIVSDGVWSTAIGTAFSVQREGEAGVRTTVLHGKVGVSNGQRAPQRIVAAHQRAVVRGASEPAEVVAIGRNEESPEWALLGPTKLWNDAVAATLELSDVPEGARAWIDGQDLGRAPLSTLVPVGYHRIEVRVGESAVWSRELALAAGERAAFSLAGIELAAPERAAKTPRRAKPLPSEPAAAKSAAELLKQARRLLREGALDEAAATYEALMREHARSEEARIGLLSLAELELEHLGQPSAALAHAERYLAGAGGSLRPEAEETRIRALRSLGRHAEERAAIEAFLEAHPESLRARTLEQRLAALQAP